MSDILASPSSSLPPYTSDGAQLKSSLTASVEKLMVEGDMERTTPDKRLEPDSALHVALIWISCNLTAENMILGMLGPLQYKLSFLDSFLCGIGGAIIGSIATAYVATFGPMSGHRTMAISRFIMGWFPAKMTAALNFTILMGYLIIDAVAAGQILAAVSTSETISVVVGILLTICLTGIISIVGIRPFQIYERYAWISQVMAICILSGAAFPEFSTGEVSSSAEMSQQITVGHRLSFFSLCLAGSITYAPCAADVFVYLPESTKPLTVFLQTLVGLVLSFAATFLVGTGLGSGVKINSSWQRAYDESPGTLIAESLSSLNALGTVCGIILALGIVANMIMPSYSISFSLQAMGSWFSTIPRPICTLAGMIACALCAVWGRANLAAIMTNFVSLMGYWVTPWIAIFLEEDIIFRRYMKVGYNWDAWNDRKGLPLGYASATAFFIGWVGVVLCMAQTWYTGPVAAAIGMDGADIGSLVGFGVTAATYPLLRYVELRVFKR